MINNYLEYVSQCSKLAEYHRDYHRDGKLPIPDEDYDQLRKEVIAWEVKHPDQTLELSPAYKVGFIEPESMNEDCRHEYPMLSLENALDADECESWVNLWTTKFGPDLKVIGEFKYDGMALSLRYIDGSFTRALTRGDGIFGEDVTQKVSLFVPETIQAEGVVEIRGEAIIKKTWLEVINMGPIKYANCRSAVVGILNPSRNEAHIHTRGVSFVPYDLEGPDFKFNTYFDKLEALKQLGFQMLSCFNVTPSGIQEVFESIKDIRSRGDLPFDIDGMVWKINDIDKQIELGETNHSPRHSFAYKFPPVKGECELLDVVFQVGRTGEIAPVAKITATTLMGVVVTSVSLHNEEHMKARKIAIGNTYEVYRSGDVIPHIGKLVKEKEDSTHVEFPKCCPSCNSPVSRRGAAYYCENTVSCPAQNVASIAYAVSRDALNVAGLAENTVALLIKDSLVRCTADIFNLSEADIERLNGYTQYSANKLRFAIINASRTTFDRYIISLGIPGVGKSTARSLAQKIFKRKTIFSLTTPEAVLDLKVKDIGEETAKNVANFFSDAQKRLDAEELLNSLMIDDMPEVQKIPGVTGKSFVFTGSFTEPRELMENKVLSAGGTVLSSISSRVDYLVAGERAGSKLRKANMLKIEVIDERVFRSLFEPGTPDSNWTIVNF